MTARLFVKVAGLEARTKLSYRVDFWITVVATVVIELGLYYYICLALFEGGEREVAGYTLEGLLLYYVTAVLVGKIVRASEFEGTISDDIYQGGLNRYLVFPSAYLPFKLAQLVGALLPIVMQTVVMGIVVAIAFELPAGVAPTLTTMIMASVSLCCAVLLYFLMGYPIHCVAFWADNVWSLSVALRLSSGLLGGLMVPLAMFPDWARGVLEWLPFRFLYAFPVEALLGRVEPGAWLLGIAITGGWCVLFWLVGDGIFRRGALQYSGVGI